MLANERIIHIKNSPQVKLITEQKTFPKRWIRFNGYFFLSLNLSRNIFNSQPDLHLIEKNSTENKSLPVGLVKMEFLFLF